MNRKNKPIKKMATVTSRLSIVVERAKTKAFDERQNVDHLIDKLLDNILEFQNLISKKIDTIEDAISDMESLTWQYGKDISDEDLKEMSTLISIAKDLGSQWKEEYTSLVNANGNNYASKQLNEYGDVIGDFIDVTNDLDFAFFKFPNQLNKLNSAS